MMSSVVSQLYPLLDLLRFVRGCLMLLSCNQVLEHNAGNHNGGSRKLKREESFRFLQKPQLDALVRELDRSSEVLGDILRQ